MRFVLFVQLGLGGGNLTRQVIEPNGGILWYSDATWGLRYPHTRQEEMQRVSLVATEIPSTVIRDWGLKSHNGASPYALTAYTLKPLTL